MIDVGGPSMLRAAAKNFAHVAAVCRPEQYELVLAELREHGELSLETRRRLAAEAFATTAAYEAAIATWFARGERFPEQLTLVVPQGRRPPVRREPAPGGRALLRGRRPQAPALARRAARRQGALVQQPRRPRGRAARRARVRRAGRRDRQAREPVRRRGRRRRSRRRTSARSRPTRSRRSAASRPQPPGQPGRSGERIAEQFVEVLFAPGYDDGRARGARARSRRCGSCRTASGARDTPGERDYKRVLGGLLVQDARRRDRRTARR